MKLLFRIILSGFSLFSIFSILSCASTMTGKETSQLTVGIWNEFPDTPNYIRKQTFVFRHKITGYETQDFKQNLTRTAGEYLTSKGYKIIDVNDKTALDDGTADMIVQIRPMDIYKQEGTLGYGFYDRSILKVLVKQPARAYVSLNMILHKKGSSRVKQTGRQESSSRLEIIELPDSPDQLTEQQKKEMSLNLDENIRKTIFKALPILGL